VRSLALAATLCFGAAAFAESSGIPPRSSRTNYPIACFTEHLAVGAFLMSPDTVRASFGAEVEKRYLVVEVGVFPKIGKIDVKHSDFALRLVSPQILSKPVTLQALAENGGARVADKLLPETGTNKPIGGYLVFSLPDPAVYTAYELDYKGHGAWLTLPLTPKRR
jgi:hypothetical protein